MIPEGLYKRKSFFEKNIKIILLIITAVVAMILFYASERRQINIYTSKIQEMSKNIKTTEALVGKEDELSKLESENEKKNSVADTLKAGRFDWPKRIDGIISVMPDSISLVAIKGDYNSIEIEGESQSNTSIATFLLSLHSFDYIQDIKPIIITNSNNNILNFTITVKLKAVQK